MDKFVIQGKKRLSGAVEISGAKNSALKLLAASLLNSEPVVLDNVPHLTDIHLMIRLLGDLGVRVCFYSKGSIELHAKDISDVTVPYQLVRAMRASIVLLGPLLARTGEAKVALPGGCAIGTRPVDLHLSALRRMGAEISLNEGFIIAKAPGGLKGASISMSKVTVTGTENIMMAASLAAGVTTIENAAREPEVVDLANLLNAMGAKVKGAGTDTITIEGVKALHSCEYSVLPDRIEAGTFLTAAAITGGKITVEKVIPSDLKIVLQSFKEAGAKISQTKDSVTLDMHKRKLQAVTVETGEYPGYPTDMQAQMLVLNSVSDGVGMITETIFENRFMHVPELQRLGAEIRVKGDTATTVGVDNLVGAPVTATDLRACAGLVLAGLAAEGTTEIDGLNYLDRGYAHVEEKLLALGADIQRHKETDRV